MLIAINKPYGVLSQFTKEHPSHRTLAELGLPSGVYPIGRLDSDSEGLLLLSDDGRWNQQLLHPTKGHERTYHVQVEGIPAPDAITRLTRGVQLPDFHTLPCKVQLLESAPPYPARVPPIRERKSIPTSWLAMKLVEGKNRQVRRMTAAVGYPTLRLIRAAMGKLELAKLDLEPGQWRELTAGQIKLLLA